jgi:hypothetical protein
LYVRARLLVVCYIYINIYICHVARAWVETPKSMGGNPRVYLCCTLAAVVTCANHVCHTNHFVCTCRSWASTFQI